MLFQHKKNPDFTLRERLRAYCDALANHGISFNENLLFEDAQTFQGGYQCMQKVLNLKKRPTAVATMCDLSASGAIKAAQDAGLKVPQDISIAGYMGLELMKNTIPRLTTVSLKFKELGNIAANAALDLASSPHKTPSITKIIPPELIIGDTTSHPEIP